MHPVNRTKILGAYLIGAGLAQACLYVWLSVSKDDARGLYFDPRIGIFFLETAWRGGEQVVPGVLRWLSAGWILTLGVLLFSGRRLVKTYIVSEIVLSLPNIIFAVIIVLANLSPAHGFSVRELTLPILVMIAFSVVPLTLAIGSYGNKKTETATAAN